MTKEIVLITGAGGMVAKELSAMLSDRYSIRFLTRKKRNDDGYEWDIDSKTIDLEALKGVSHIIHLAGTNIAEGRWTAARKKAIYDSRVKSAEILLEGIKSLKMKVKTFVSSSATGYYGTQTTPKIYTENDAAGTGFLSEICVAWEAVADAFLAEGVAGRVVKIRSGVVLSPNGGLVQKMLPLVKFGLGTSLGSGKQYLPWIHSTDLCRMYRYAIENKQLEGAVNGVAPQHITNQEFTKMMGLVLHRSVWLPSVPSFLLKWIFGELSVTFLEGSRVSADKILNAGFEFEYPEVDKALENIVG
ncbi:MAG: TIGR01777 family oxidoreductase [Capnocytophaga sp.]|nr:TIGR01777 family oxidoreductase [Capnocytophaga sp.]